MGPEGKTTFMSVVCVAVVVSVLVLHSCDDYRHDRRLARSCLLSMAVVRGLPGAPLPLSCPTCSTVFQVDTAMNILSPFTTKLGEAIDAHGVRTDGRWHFRRRRSVRSTTTRQFCSCLHNILFDSFSLVTVAAVRGPNPLTSNGLPLGGSTWSLYHRNSHSLFVNPTHALFPSCKADCPTTS